MSRDQASLAIILALSLRVLTMGTASGGTAVPGNKAKVERVFGTAPRDDAGAAAAFEAMLAVLHHPRCMNCHSSGDFPRQGDDGHPHAMNVRRGSEGQGVTAQKCGACHQDHNLPGRNMPPGAHDWHMPPRNTPMIWAGLSDNQLCELLKDPKQNGNRSVASMVEHMTTPKLVLWGWNPGEGRAPIPMAQAEFAARVKEWAAKGAACPASSRAAQAHR